MDFSEDANTPIQGAKPFCCSVPRAAAGMPDHLGFVNVKAFIRRHAISGWAKTLTAFG